MTTSERWGFSDEIPPRGKPPKTPPELVIAVLAFLGILAVLAALL